MFIYDITAEIGDGIVTGVVIARRSWQKTFAFDASGMVHIVYFFDA
jgi:hypothetical protein